MLSRPAALSCVLLLLAGAGACRTAIGGFGNGIRARIAAEQLFGAFADRHVELVRNAKYEYARVRMTRGALSPSRVFEDSAVWTRASGPVRLLETFGSHAEGRYHLSSRPNVPAPSKPADGRHLTTLSRLSDNEFRWDTNVDFAIGPVRPNEVADVVTRLLSSGEGRTEAELRAELAATSPRAGAVLSNVFSLDSIRPAGHADGTTSMTLVVGIHSDALRRHHPAFGDYVRRYVDPARFHFLVTDRAGVPFIELTGRDRAIVVRLRTQRGHLVPLAGPPRPLPDSLIVLADFTVKVKIFRVGFHDLQMDLVNSGRGDEERAWTFTAKREPQWNLPLITARLLRAPLRRPFAGEGALFRIGVRAGTAGGPTVLLRQSRLAVQESAILNFLNSLGNTAMDDFGGPVEREEAQWLRELFLALRDDLKSAIPGP